MFLSNKNNNKKIFSFLVTAFNFVTLILTCSEIYIYPGVVKNYTHISIIVLLFLSAIFSIAQKKTYPLLIEKIILFLPLLLIPISIYLNIEEKTHYSNFVFSQYHILPSAFQNVLFFFVIQFVATVIYKKSYLKKINSIFFIKKFKHQTLILLLFSILLSSFLLKNNFYAKWGIIDDHEIVNFLGVDHKISPKEFQSLILSTEVGDFGTSLRYRPAYYFLRVAESAIWGNNPQFWYLTLLAILIVFLFTLSYIVANSFGFVPAIILNLFVMTETYWSDIWARLGPGEIYVVLGLSMYSFGLYKIFVQKSKSIFPWILFLFGGLIAIGSKENMVILTIPALYILIDKIIRHNWTWELVFPCLHILFASFISISIYLAINKTGHNFYNTGITTSGILALIVPSLKKTIIDLKIIDLFLIVFLFLIPNILISKKIYYKDFFVLHYKAIFLLIFLFQVYFSQFIFYSGFWPTNMRYDFPGIISKQFFWILSLYLLFKLAPILNSYKSNSYMLVLNVLFFGSLIISISNTGYSTLFRATENNTAGTTSFIRKLTTLSDLTKIYFNYPLVFKGENSLSYERVFSLERFARFMDISNSIYLNYYDTNLSSRVGLDRQLSEELTQLSKDGLPGVLKGRYDSQKAGKNCIMILINGAKNDNECDIDIAIE